MSKPELYRQCRLESGTVYQICWIPEKLAVVGGSLNLAGDSRRWTVKEVWERQEYIDIKNLQHNTKEIWEATSVPQPIGHK